MRRSPSLSATLAAALCLLAPAPRSHAQAAPTLAQALAQAEVSRDTVYLAVAADKVALPKNAPPPPPGAPVAQVADAYGRLACAWETAGAVAPPTMTLLNTEPGAPNPYDGMPAADALKLLLGGLDDGQWQALTSDGGLGYASLTTEAQQQLFMALFPGGTLTALPPGDYNFQHGFKLTTGDLQQARLRLSGKVDIMLPGAGSPGSFMGSRTDMTDGQTHYTAIQSFTVGADGTAYGAHLRATVPNALKPSDLDAADLAVPVPLAGIRTVGDLVARIGTATKTELYADRRYEGRSVTLVGPPSAHAGDLLRALAVCVCGAYRKVGPAYVLTDDLLGYGTRQMTLGRFAQTADMTRATALADIGDRLLARGGVTALPPTAPGFGVTDAEREAQDADSFGFGPGSVQVPFSQLTPQQQDAARRELQYLQQHTKNFTAAGQIIQPSLQGKLKLVPQPTLQLLTGAVPGPVTLDDSMNMSMHNSLFQPSAKLRQQRQMAVPPPKRPMPAVPPTPSLASLLAPLPRRAVYARPRTAADVDALVGSMRRLGLNQLWLDVFSEGKSHLEGTGTPDILTEALAKTKGTGIAVIPTLSLLTWGLDAPEDAADRTVLGETSAQAADDQQHYQDVINQNLPEEADPSPKTLAACPAAPAVVDTLTALVGRLAATPGVTALALQDTVTPGYALEGGSSNNFNGSDLGYTVPLRLACLRRTHLDPVDFDFSAGILSPVNSYVSLTDFGAAIWPMTPEAQAAGRQWDAVRAEADLSLMRGLLAAAQTSAGRRLPFLVKQRGASWTSDWWGLWDDPRAPLPVLAPQAIGTVADDGFAAYAHSQCRVDVYALSPVFTRSAGGLAFAFQQMKPGWDGVVIDASDAQTGDPLAPLAKSMAPAAAARVSP